MDVIRNIENNKNSIDKNEIEYFIEELQNTLEKEECKTDSIYKEILEEIPLASKYKSKLNSIIKKCMEDLSYEDDFIYFDYDKKEKIYFLDSYSEGNITRVKMTPEDIKNTHLKNGTFWRIYDEEYIVEADYYKDNIKINVESELEMLDFYNK